MKGSGCTPKERSFRLVKFFTGSRLGRGEAEFAKLLRAQPEHLRELEDLYYEHSESQTRVSSRDVLQQILQVQEVGTTQEYNISGSTFIVHVLEDTEL